MRALVKLTIFGLLATLFLPHVVAAYSLQAVGTSISATTNQNLYRLRGVGKTWQLSTLTADQLSDAPVNLAGQLLLTAKTGNTTALFHASGLKTEKINGVAAEAISLVKRESVVFAALQTGSNVTVSAIKPDFSAVPLPGLTLTNLDQVGRFFMLGSDYYYAEQLNQFVRIQHWQGGSWEVTASFPCTNSAFLPGPLVGVSCAEGQYYFPLTAASWQPLFPTAIQNFTTSETVMVASDIQNNLYIWQNNTLLTFTLALNGRSITGSRVAADRVFLKLSDASWWEFGLADHSLSQTPGDASAVNAADNASQLWLKVGTGYFVSDAAGSWQAVTSEGDWTAMKKVTGGWLAFTQNGSVVQFAADAATAFHKVTSSWAASSKVQSVYAQADLGLILLLNSSNNPNLYQSTDFQTWSRLTLPSIPTFAVTIGEARALPANSLVDTTGVISVPTGAVSGETLYIQDATGGIQIFLDSSKGGLPNITGKQATVTGTISTSQNRHITLAALDDLVLGADQTLTLQNLDVNELVSHLGQAATTQATISEIGSGYFSLSLTNGSLKFHYPTGLLNFMKDSVVKLPLVTDYNSASGTVESWYLGTGAALVSAPAVTATNSAVAPLATAVTVATSKSTTSKAKVAPVKTTLAPPQLVSSPKRSNQPASSPVLVSGTQENDTTQTVALALTSFMAGALAMRGRRLQQLLRV